MIGIRRIAAVVFPSKIQIAPSLMFSGVNRWHSSGRKPASSITNAASRNRYASGRNGCSFRTLARIPSRAVL